MRRMSILGQNLSQQILQCGQRFLKDSLGKVHVTIEENGGVQREIDLDSSVFLNGTCP